MRQRRQKGRQQQCNACEQGSREHVKVPVQMDVPVQIDLQLIDGRLWCGLGRRASIR